MNLFDQLVDSAHAAQPTLASLRPAVEKEILHHDILREMGKGGFLDSLTFIGGTCLRDCYGSARLSEDLDFTGGADFERESLSALGELLSWKIHDKYGLPVSVGEPRRESGTVDTWKIKVVTRPEHQHFPSQKINIDICAIESHDRKPTMIRNHYGTGFGTSGMVLKAESRKEIFADKILAIGLRPNRVKYRDIWDIIWLANQGIGLDQTLFDLKLADRKAVPREFGILLRGRIEGLEIAYEEYLFEMRRFLPRQLVSEVEGQEGYWSFVLSILRDIALALPE
ncbi:MAG: nucleotidyl transferase AbiEii/AbiGii toxin family protein [Spirochaetota bacterium]